MSLPMRWIVGVSITLALAFTVIVGFRFWYIGVFDVFPVAEKCRKRRQETAINTRGISGLLM